MKTTRQRCRCALCVRSRKQRCVTCQKLIAAYVESRTFVQHLVGGPIEGPYCTLCLRAAKPY